MSLNPTSSADSSSCVATAMWRSTPARSSSSCSDRLRPTDSGMKIRGKTTVDLSGSTGRREGTAPSTFNAGTSLTFGLSLPPLQFPRSEEHTSELQSHLNLVCRLLLEKKKKKDNYMNVST